MKRVFSFLLIVLFLTHPMQAQDNGQCLQAAQDEMNDLYKVGCGCEDGIFNAISASMLGWGVGLFVGIALLTGLIHNAHHDSTSSSSSSSE